MSRIASRISLPASPLRRNSGAVATPVDVGRPSQLALERHKVEHGRRTPFAFGRQHPAAAVIAHQERVDELFLVAERSRPQLLAGDFIRVQVDGRIFVLYDGGVVGELRLAQPVDPEVFLAVYHRETRGKVLCEEFVDDREGAVVIGVRLLDMRVEQAWSLTAEPYVNAISLSPT